MTPARHRTARHACPQPGRLLAPPCAFDGGPRPAVRIVSFPVRSGPAAASLCIGLGQRSPGNRPRHTGASGRPRTIVSATRGSQTLAPRIRGVELRTRPATGALAALGTFRAQLLKMLRPRPP